MKRVLPVVTVGVLLLYVLLQTNSIGAETNFGLSRIKLVSTAKLSGSFVSTKAVYADSDRVYLCSYQGDLFVLKRDKRAGFPRLQTIHLGAPLTAIRGNRNNIYVTSTNGTLYVFSKSWPLELVRSTQLSNYGLTSLEVIGDNVYLAKGQAAMAASETSLYLSELNAGDAGLDLTSGRSFGEAFSPRGTQVFDRHTLHRLGEVRHAGPGQVSIAVAHDFLYLTTPGCCGQGIDIYDAVTLRHTQFIKRPANTIAVSPGKHANLLLAGSEAGTIDLYVLRDGLYTFVNNLNLRALTAFTGPDDIEIRSLWVDEFDNLIFAASSWGNDQSRSPDLPSLFILELQPKFQETTWQPRTGRTY